MNFLVTVLLGACIWRNVENAAVPVLGDVYPENHPLLIKAYPAVENFQSNLYEVYAEPYTYDLRTISAVAVLESEGENGVKGEIVFVQNHPPTSLVLIRGNVTGLKPGKHGFHIHESGDLRQGCEKIGEHFNPYFFQHGGPVDGLRHVGDLGNVKANDEGIAEINIVDPIISLSNGPRGIVGRAIVVTTDPDDLGRGGSTESITDGSSGAPLACGVIAYIR